jgi:hypothetical protein
VCFTARAGEPELADVNPDVAELYRRKLKRLAEELAEDPSSEDPAIALRSLIGEVVLTPAGKCSVPSTHVGHAELTDIAPTTVQVALLDTVTTAQHL